MSISSLAKFSNVLGSVSQKRSSSGAPSSQQNPPAPEEVILLAVREKEMLPVDDLIKVTSLKPDVILDGVERLRAKELVEIVEFTETGMRKFIRLTSKGYASFSA